MRSWLAATASSAGPLAALATLPALAALSTLAALPLELPGLHPGRWRPALEARRRPARPGLTAACAALASL